MLLALAATGALDLPRAVVVVGSGAAGTAVALALADRGQRVVLLESGGAAGVHPEADADCLNEGVVEGLPFGLTATRTRGLGGTTRLWHGQCMRLHRIDLLPRAWVPDSGWPLPPEELDRHYRAAEAFFGLVGEHEPEARWAGFRRPPPLAWDPTRLLEDATEYAPEPDVDRLHGHRLRSHPLVSTVVNATVGRVLTEDGAATGVEVLDVEGRRHTIVADRVVLAAGAIENVRLLQLSDPDGIGLGHGRRHTGRYLQTHPFLRTADVELAEHALLQDRYTIQRHGRRRMFPKVRLAPAAQERHRLLDATAVFLHEHDETPLARARRGARALARQPVRTALDTDLRRALALARAVVRDGCRHVVRGLGTGERPSSVGIEVWLEQQPDAESKQDLAPTRDVFGLRQARVRWLVGEPEIRTSRVLTRWIAEDLRRLAGARVVELPPMHDDEAWRGAVQDGAHPSGGTRMSLDGATGVVDPDLRVHGVRGLYAVGGSVFPTAGYANPTLTIVALALRLADHLTCRPGAESRCPVDRRRRRRRAEDRPTTHGRRGDVPLPSHPERRRQERRSSWSPPAAGR